MPTVSPTSMVLILILFKISILAAGNAGGGIVQEEYYNKCKGVTAENASPAVTFRSSVDCIRNCSSESNCWGVNICPLGYRREVMCQWTFEPHACENLTAADQPTCHYVQKISMREMHQTTEKATTTEQHKIPQTTEQPTTTEFCLNGGTPDGLDSCACPLGFRGNRCHKYIRDCAEPYKKDGYQSGSFKVMYIQPNSAPSPFLVRCKFDNSPMTVVLRRNKDADFPHNWTSCKNHFKGNLESNPTDPNNYFIGLENLHHLLKQAKYNLQIHMFDVGGSSYQDVSVGPESNSYDISFSSGGDGFTGNPPKVFSADGNDVNGCYSYHGKAGWYADGTACKGYGMFSDAGPEMSWWHGGQLKSTYQMDFIFYTKSSDHYDI